jgi:ribosomal protein L37E
MTYSTGFDKEGNPYIRCKRCGLTSYYPTDVLLKYCGHCHIFHEDEVRCDPQ